MTEAEKRALFFTTTNDEALAWKPRVSGVAISRKARVAEETSAVVEMTRRAASFSKVWNREKWHAQATDHYRSSLLL